MTLVVYKNPNFRKPLYIFLFIKVSCFFSYNTKNIKINNIGE
uniref:Uncharacterized protein n=1 Tax=uncultured bacterium contig00013 TaxID=1181504 RepID=A0A806KQW5_9BACT|nr:hypothetical protein [uncultured bacterium contig00013]